MFRKEIKVTYDDTNTKQRLKDLEKELGTFREYRIDPFPKSRLTYLEAAYKEDNEQLRLTLKALEWRLRKLEADG